MSGGDAVDVAQAKDQRDDGLRGDGIEAGGGRIVENDGRPSDQGAGDGDATAHAAGEFGRQHVDGVLEFDEAKDFLHLRRDVFFVGAIFEQTIGDIFADGEGIEERAFLENKTNLAAELQEFLFRFAGNVLAKSLHGAAIGSEQAGGNFQGKGFAGAGFAEQDESFTGLRGKGKTTKNRAFVETDPDVVELDGERSAVRSGRQGVGMREGVHERQSLSAKIECEFREEGVGDDDHHGRDDDGLGGGAADSLRTTADVQALITAYGGKDEGEDQEIS